MKASFEIDYKRDTISINKEIQKKFITLAARKIQLTKIVTNFKIFKTIRHFNIDRKTVIANLIKILGEDFVYYSEIEYIPEYHAYEIFNQI